MSALRRFVITALTPLALTVLASEPGRAQPGPHLDTLDRAPPTMEGEHGEGHAEFDANPLHNLGTLHYGKDIEGGTLEPGEHKMPPPFLAVIFNFLAFIWLLGRFAYPSIRRATFERHDEIAKALAEGTKLREEARARLGEYERKLAGLQGEIDTLVASIRGEAEAEKKRIIAEAETRAERMRRDAEQQIAAEMQRVRLTLEREAVQAAVGIAERVLSEKTTDADQRVLADRFLKGLQDAAARRRTPV